MSSLSRPKLRLGALALAAFASAFAQAPAPAQEGAPVTLAVLPLWGVFNVPKPATPNPGQYQRPQAGYGQPPQAQAGANRQGSLEAQLNQRVTMAFFGTGRFQLIERAQLNAVLSEGKFEHSGLVDDATAAKLGRQMGASFVVVGSYTGSLGHSVEVKTGFFGSKSRKESYPGHLEVRLRMVNTEDGSIREAFLVTAESTDEKGYHSYELLLDDFSKGLLAETTARFPMTGYVIKVLSEHEALVDLGRKQRLEKGASFQLVEQGADVVHPVTGKLVKGERRVLTDLKVIDVGDESSTMKVIGIKVTLKVGQVVVQMRQ